MDDQRYVACTDEGCSALKHLASELRKDLNAQTQLLRDNANIFNRAVEKISTTAIEMNRTLAVQNERLQYGSDKFDSLEKDVRELKELKTTVRVLEDRIPSRSASAVAGGGGAGFVVFCYEIIKTLLV